MGQTDLRPLLIVMLISSEGANALSYIGGYMHEAAFSMMVVTFVLAIYLNTGISFIAKAGLILMGVFGIMLANSALSSSRSCRC